MVETGLLNAAVTGLVTGSVVALGAIGLALVYSIAEVPNFAHGELLMIGAYVGLVVNKPAIVPVYELFATGTQSVGAVGLVLLFVLAAGALLGAVYMLGGRKSLAGDWWPVSVSDTVGYAGHAVAAVLFGGLVVFSTPSIWGGLLLAMAVMAVVAPLIERTVFRKFRSKGVDLATMLIVALGVSFVLRFGMQALWSGKNRFYEVPSIANVGGFSVPLSATQYFDFFVTGSGVVLRIINTGAVGQTGAESRTFAVVGLSWMFVLLLFAVTGGVAALAYRWRRVGPEEFGGGQTFGPRIIGSVAGVVAFLVVAFALSRPASVPDSSVYSTRVSLSVMRGSLILLTLTMMGVLHVLLKETKLGTAMRASSDNMDLAKVTGINTDRVMMVTWIIAGVYAAIGGVMLGILFSQINPNMGFFLLLPMFAGVILGGIGSVYGAMLGSYLVGLSMDVGIVLFGVDATYRIPIAFVVLFAVLLVKPEGLVGGR